MAGGKRYVCSPEVTPFDDSPRWLAASAVQDGWLLKLDRNRLIGLMPQQLQIVLEICQGKRSLERSQ